MKSTVAAIVLGIVLLGGAIAHAQPLTPDYAQPPNGIGYGGAHILTPGWSPVQVPEPDLTRTTAATTLVAHPFLSPWVHRLVPIPAGTEVELRGAAAVSVPDADGRRFVVNPNGHCLFDGPAPSAHYASITSLPPVRIETSVLQLVIEPTVRR